MTNAEGREQLANALLVLVALDLMFGWWLMPAPAVLAVVVMLAVLVALVMPRGQRR